MLWGYSGGGPAMSFYQAVAETGVAFCQDPHKLVKCDSTGSTSLVGLPPADGIVFVDAHPGVGTIGMLRSNDPAVTNENNPDKHLNKKLDPFDPKNGFNPNGESKYSNKFKQAYFEGQSARTNRLIDEALEIQKQIDAGTNRSPTTLLLLSARAIGEDRLDPSILHSTTSRAHAKGDVTITIRIL